MVIEIDSDSQELILQLQLCWLKYSGSYIKSPSELGELSLKL